MLNPMQQPMNRCTFTSLSIYLWKSWNSRLLWRANFQDL